MQSYLRETTPSTPYAGEDVPLKDRFRNTIAPGLILVTGGTSCGKTSVYNALKELGIFGHDVPEYIDALSLANNAWKEHGPTGKGLGVTHIHPTEVHEQLQAEEVYIGDTYIGHRHLSPVGADNPCAHFPFDTTNTLLPLEYKIKNAPHGNPLIIATYQEFFSTLAHQTLHSDQYHYTEVAGGKNMLTDHKHPMYGLDVSYTHLADILTHMESSIRNTLRHKITMILNIEAKDHTIRMERAGARKGTEARSVPLVDVFGENDAEVLREIFPHSPFITIDNTIDRSGADFHDHLSTSLQKELKRITS